MQEPISRRAILAGLATLATETGWSQVLCPRDPSVSNPQAPLTIDTHAHFFNGRDLQVREFLSQTTVGPDSELYPLVNALSGFLQLLGWNQAPDAASERAAIAKYAGQLAKCEGPMQLRTLAGEAYNAAYKVALAELQKTSREFHPTPQGAAVLGPRDGKPGLAAAIANLPDDYERYEEQQADTTSLLGSQPTLAGYIRFVLHQFNYRHVNAIEYLNTYSRGSTRKVDLIAASMVDYDWWLAQGKQTPTTLTDQIDLMGRISVLLAGRVHGFAPFCPFREAVTRDASGIGDSMRLVRRAIEAHGFIGVKLYPPMGFAAWGNTGKTVWQDKGTLPAAARDPGFGASLDGSMRSLFTYCMANDVPIMAHTNQSNGPYEEFRELAGSEYWKQALEKFPGLSVSFGHFGDSDPEDHSGNRTRPFLKLMTRGGNSPGSNTYADSGYFAGTLLNQVKMRDVLRSLYASEGRILLERLMYGSDWTMILTQHNVERYLADFAQVIRRIEELEPSLKVRQTSLSDAFFARNAIEFLGLRKGRGNRVRLERFYAAHGVGDPDWMQKVGSA